MAESLVPKIEHITYIDVPIGQVYETLTTADGWDSWFTDGTTLDAAPGGQVRFRWVDFGPMRMTTEDGGRVLEVQENRKFVFQWQPGKAVTTVSIELDRLGKGTRLRLDESGYSMDDVEAYGLCRWLGGGPAAAQVLPGERDQVRRGTGPLAGAGMSAGSP